MRPAVHKGSGRTLLVQGDAEGLLQGHHDLHLRGARGFGVRWGAQIRVEDCVYALLPFCPLRVRCARRDSRFPAPESRIDASRVASGAAGAHAPRYRGSDWTGTLHQSLRLAGRARTVSRESAPRSTNLLPAVTCAPADVPSVTRNREQRQKAATAAALVTPLSLGWPPFLSSSATHLVQLHAQLLGDDAPNLLQRVRALQGHAYGGGAK